MGGEMKSVATLMLLLTAASAALADPDACQAIYKPLPTKDLSQVFGEWRLLWGAGEVLPITELKSSAVSLQADGDAIRYLERNLFNNGSCVTYNMNVSKPAQDGGSVQPLVLRAVIDYVASNGTQQPMNASFTLKFYQRSPDAMLMFVEAGEMGRFLLSYARQGHVMGLEQREGQREKLMKMLTCLAFRDYQVFVEDGLPELCQPEAPAGAAGAAA
ncbi:saxitoxin and tetrodotoxin-binding protein 2-like [Stigmatopora nigra]